MEGFNMSYQDKELYCKECGQKFLFSAGEQEFFAEKGFQNEPGRCPNCRARRRQGGGRSTATKKREMHKTSCSRCGAETEVPFKPTGEKPVYCRDCYKTRAL
jgi:CxxC-x17-CxxC domain-containing protein